MAMTGAVPGRPARGRWLGQPRPLVLVLGVTVLSACAQRFEPTDYDRELAGLDREAYKLQIRLAGAPTDDEGVSARRAYVLYQRAALTGDFRDYRIAEATIDTAFQLHASSEELYYFRALLNFQLHRLGDVKADLARLSMLAYSAQVRVLKADVALQEGRYGETSAEYGRLLADSRTWPHLARTAYLTSKTGDVGRGDQLYEEAQADVTAKEMRSYAWLELQRGVIDLEEGRYADALAHYERADAAYSGYWLIEEHLAEVLALLGRTDRAVALYETVLAKNLSPEYANALADLLEDQRPEEAAQWRARAEAQFAEQLEIYPEAAVGHVVAALLSRVDETDWERLLELATWNYEIRPNAEAAIMLADAYLKVDDTAAAAEMIRRVLESPWRTPALKRVQDELKRATVDVTEPRESHGGSLERRRLPSEPMEARYREL